MRDEPAALKTLITTAPNVSQIIKDHYRALSDRAIKRRVGDVLGKVSP